MIHTCYSHATVLHILSLTTRYRQGDCTIMLKVSNFTTDEDEKGTTIKFSNKNNIAVGDKLTLSLQHLSVVKELDVVVTRAVGRSNTYVKDFEVYAATKVRDYPNTDLLKEDKPTKAAKASSNNLAKARAAKKALRGKDDSTTMIDEDAKFNG